MKIKILVLLIIVLSSKIAGAVEGGAVNATQCFQQKWPSELSELQPDSSLYRGKLSNGFRYVIKQNSRPEDRVAIYLSIRAGSLHEDDDQRGVAHFLEHMMFNGTAHFPSGKLIQYFQSIGMNFGGDTNAHTTYDETVYRIILPGGSQENLEAAFLILADFAGGALLSEKEIDRERAVILAEKRERDTAAFRAYKAANVYTYRGTRYPERLPIGLEKTLKSVGRSQLKAYYDSWYRPQNMDLVVVGEVQPEEVEELIEKQFDNLQSSGPDPDCPDFGKLKHHGIEYFYHHEPELGHVTLAIETLWETVPQNDSLVLEEQELHKLISSMVMRYRLQQEMEGDDVPFLNPSYHSSDILDHVGYGRITAESGKNGWQETLIFLEKQIRQAVTYGFNEKEVDRARKEILAYFDERVLAESTMDSRAIARRIIRHLNSNRVYQSANQENELYTPLVKRVTAEKITSVFRQVWGHRSRLISVMGDVNLGADARQRITQTYDAAQTREVVPAGDLPDVVFPYLTPAKNTSDIVETTNYSDLDIESITFANGLVLHLKKTDFDKNTFQLIANFGGGQQILVEEGAALLFSELINGSGTTQLSRPSIEALTAQSSVKLGFNVGRSAFSWSGSGLTRDFKLFCQFLHSFLLDPTAREHVFSRVMKDTSLLYENLDHRIEGAVALKVRPFLANFKGHFGLPEWSAVQQNSFSGLARYINELKKINGLEISVVGDFERELIVKTITDYFSGIDIGKVVELQPPVIKFPEGGKLKVKVETIDEKSLVTVAWPTEDISNIRRSRQLHTLAKVFEDRLRKQVREKLGASYAPSVTSYCSKLYENYGYLRAEMIVDPQDEKKIIKEILRLSEDLAQHGITEEELDRLKKPILTSLKESLKRNSYWLYSVMSNSSKKKEQLVWPQTIVADFMSTNAQQVNHLAERYLITKKAAVIEVVPVLPEGAGSKHMGD